MGEVGALEHREGVAAPKAPGRVDRSRHFNYYAFEVGRCRFESVSAYGCSALKDHTVNQFRRLLTVSTCAATSRAPQARSVGSTSQRIFIATLRLWLSNWCLSITTGWTLTPSQAGLNRSSSSSSTTSSSLSNTTYYSAYSSTFSSNSAASYASSSSSSLTLPSFQSQAPL
jgi:hypothetical protein